MMGWYRFCIFLLLSAAMTVSYGSDLDDCLADVQGLSGPELADYIESCRVASLPEYVEEIDLPDNNEDAESSETPETKDGAEGSP